MRSLTRWLLPPSAADPEEALRAKITHWIVVVAFVSTGLLVALLLAIEPKVGFMLPIYIASMAASLFSYVLLHTGRLRAAGMFIAFLALLITYAAAFSIGGVRSPQLATAVLVIVVTGFLVSTRAAIWVAFGSSLSLLALVYGRSLGVVPEPSLDVSPYTTWAALTLVLALAAVFLHIFVGAVTTARKEAAENSARLEQEMQLREEAEASLHRAEKLEALGRLTGGIAHDFNNILTVLLAESRLLERHAAEGRPLSPEEIEQIAEIRSSSERAAALTGQLLAFSRQRTGTPTAVDPNASIEQIEPMLQRLIREDIRLRIGPLAARGWIRIDAAQFDQVVMNLVLNARDAMPQGGQLVVSTADVDLDDAWVASHAGAQPGPHSVLTVWDTGVGIDRADLDRIFDPFFTTKGPGAGPSQGTGLGLASVHGIVTQAGGHITVESGVGNGSGFSVYLPQTEDVGGRKEEATVQASVRVAKTILLCEDDRAVRKVIRRLLDDGNYRVLEAATPARALELARTHEGVIDLLLSDIVMPGMNGRELAGAIRSARPAIRVLLVSGYASNVLEDWEDELPLLEKPFSREDLHARLDELLRSSA